MHKKYTCYLGPIEQILHSGETLIYQGSSNSITKFGRSETVHAGDSSIFNILQLHLLTADGS